MGPKVFSALAILFLLPLLAFPILVLANDDPVPSETICNSSPYPSYCKTLFQANQTSTVHDFAKFPIQKSLLQSRNFWNTLNLYLSTTTLSKGTFNAIKDCLFLSKLADYISKSILKTTNETLYIDDTQTLLSAVITNQQTCLDGLITTAASNSSIENDIIAKLSNDNKLHSVSLALFTKGWVDEKKHNTSSLWDSEGFHPGFRNGRLPLMMSNRSRAIYNSARGRKDMDDDDVAVKVRGIVVVSQDGSGNFTTINDAIAAAPNNTNINASDAGYFMTRAFGSLINTSGMLCLSFVAVVAPGFVGVNITFQNTAGPSKFQAVAMRSGADMSTFYSCSFEGYQDTLYTHSLRQFYRECDIYGTIDFILGNAAVVFQNCNIYPRLPLQGQFNPITAQRRTDPNQNTGISIHNCTIKPADDLASSIGNVKTYLGRPWKEYSRTIVMQSFLDNLIDPAGWSIWSGDFALSTLYYAEYDNRGPGANTSSRVTWPGYHVIVNATDAANFTVDSFLQGEIHGHRNLEITSN